MKKDNRAGHPPAKPAIRNADIKKFVRKIPKHSARIPVVINKSTTVYVYHMKDVPKTQQKYQYLNERKF